MKDKNDIPITEEQGINSSYSYEKVIEEYYPTLKDIVPKVLIDIHQGPIPQVARKEYDPVLKALADSMTGDILLNDDYWRLPDISENSLTPMTDAAVRNNNALVILRWDLINMRNGQPTSQDFNSIFGHDFDLKSAKFTPEVESVIYDDISKYYDKNQKELPDLKKELNIEINENKDPFNFYNIVKNDYLWRDPVPNVSKSRTPLSDFVVQYYNPLSIWRREKLKNLEKPSYSESNTNVDPLAELKELLPKDIARSSFSTSDENNFILDYICSFMATPLFYIFFFIFIFIIICIFFIFYFLSKRKQDIIYIISFPFFLMRAWFFFFVYFFFRIDLEAIFDKKIFFKREFEKEIRQKYIENLLLEDKTIVLEDRPILNNIASNPRTPKWEKATLLSVKDIKS